jgi:hypothetical protein
MYYTNMAKEKEVLRIPRPDPGVALVPGARHPYCFFAGEITGSRMRLDK